jgi:Protein of unknown function (DUF3591)/Bromodomain
MSKPAATIDFASLLYANVRSSRVNHLQIKEAYKPDSKEKKAKSKKRTETEGSSDFANNQLVQKLISKTPTYLNVIENDNEDDDDEFGDKDDDIIEMVRSWPKDHDSHHNTLPPAFHEVTMGNWEDKIHWEGLDESVKENDSHPEKHTALSLLSQPRNLELDNLNLDDDMVAWDATPEENMQRAMRVTLILELGIAGQSIAKNSLPSIRPIPFDQTLEYQRRFDWTVSTGTDEKKNTLHQNKEAMASIIEARQRKRAHMAQEKTKRVREALGTVDLGGGQGRTITSSLMGPGGTERTGRPARGVLGSTEVHDAEYLEHLDIVYNHFSSKPELSVVEMRQYHRPKLPLSFVRRDRAWQFQIRYIPTPKKADATSVNSSYLSQLAGSTSQAKIRTEADLNPTEGHLVMMEYCEERPVIQLKKGMSYKIVNYYRGDKARCPVSAGGGDRPTRRKRVDNSNVQKLESIGKVERPPRLKGIDETIGVEEWIGKAPKKKNRDEQTDHLHIDILPEGVTEILTKHVHGPFIGKIDEGVTQTGLVTNLFVAPMFLHEPESTDFLMILGKRFIGANKRPGGTDRMSVILRSIPSSVYTVGQVEPRERGLVHAPQTSGEKEFLKHFVSYHIAKHLDYFQRHERRGLNFNEIISMWAGSGIQNTALRQRIKIVAEYDSNTQIWESKSISDDPDCPDAFPGVEALGRRISPEGVVCYETACAATRRLQDIGVNTLYVGSGATVQAVNIAMAYLAGKAKVDDARKQAKRMYQALEAAKAPKSKVPSFKIAMYEKAHKKLDTLYKELKRKNEVAQFIFEELCLAPWHLTFEFIDVHKHAHGPGQLELTGFADPSGVGEGFDFRRAGDKAKGKGKKTLAVSNDGALQAQIKKITGTDNDLRKLTMKQMGAMLRSFNMPQSKIDTLKRWDRVHVIRDLSTKAASDGVGEHSRFARGEKMKLSEQKEDYQQRIQTIWNRQRSSLLSDAGDLRQAGQAGDLDPEEDGAIVPETASPIKKAKDGGMSSEDDSEDEDLEAMFVDDFQDERAGKQLFGSQKDTTEESKQDARDFAALRRNQEEQKAAQFDGNTNVNTTPGNRSMIGKQVVRRRIVKTNIDGTQTITFKFIFAEDEIEKVKMQKREEAAQERRSRKSKHVHRLNDRMFGHAFFEDDDNFELASTEVPSLPTVKGRKGALLKGTVGAKIRKPLTQVGRMKSKIGVATSLNDKRLKKRKREKEESELYVAPFQRKKSISRRERGSGGRQRLPHVKLAQKLEEIRQNVERFPSSGPFSRPVDRRKIPHYYEKISDPIDLQTIRDKNQKFQYKNADVFLREFHLMKSNAEKFNGPSHPLALEANRIYDQVKLMIEANRDELKNLETELLDMTTGDKNKASSTSNTAPTESNVTVDGLVIGEIKFDDDTDSDDSGAEFTVVEATG